MPFGIGSASQIRSEIKTALPDWNQTYSKTDAKVRDIFKKMKWSENSFFNALTFGLDAYLKKRKIREIVKEEVSSFKVSLLPKFFKQKTDLNPFKNFQIFNKNEQELLSKAQFPNFDGTPNWRAVKRHFRLSAIDLAFLTPLIDSSERELAALANFLNGNRSTFKKTDLLDAGVKLIAALRLKRDFLPLLPKKLREFFNKIKNYDRTDKHLVQIIKKNSAEQNDNIKQTIDSFLPDFLKYAQDHINTKDPYYGQFVSDITRSNDTYPLKIAHLEQDPKQIPLTCNQNDQESKKRVVTTVAKEFKQIAESFEGSEEEKNKVYVYLQVSMNQGLFGSKAGQINLAINQLQPDLFAGPSTIMREVIHHEEQKVEIKITSRNAIVLAGSQEKSSSLPVIGASFSIFIEKTPKGLEVTTDL